MTCTKCGSENEDLNNFCKNCGQTLKGQFVDDNRHQSIFDNLYQSQAKLKTDLGYLIISMIIFVNVFMWILWGLLAGTLGSENQLLFKMIRVLSVFFAVAQFVVMFIFTKRPAYKVVIVLVGFVVAAYDLYYLIRYVINSTVY